jgi:membrane associated rhomboid family serine protease
MLIPIKDDIKMHSVAIITTGLIVVNISIFVWVGMFVSGREGEFVGRFGFVPRELLDALTSHPQDVPAAVGKMVTSMFLHGGVVHAAGNMLFLWIFGNSVEDVLGRGRYSLFYLLSGMWAAVAQFSAEPAAGVPMIGASGAVSGILGAYLLLFPRAKVKAILFLFFFIKTVEIPAVVLLTAWFALQLLFAGGAGVAWFAHIGGFIFGLVSIKIFTIGRKSR